MDESGDGGESKRSLFHLRRKPPAKSKLFFELSHAQQRKEGKSASVLRQLEGNSLSDKLATYRKTIRFLIKAGHDDAVQMVTDIHKGLQDPNGRDEKGRNGLHFACRRGAEGAVLALVKEDGSIDEPDLEMRWTPMHYAVMGKQKLMVSILLKYAPTPYVTVNRRDAAGEGHAGIVRLLLDNGADINDRDNEGLTALHYAALTDQARAAEVLVDYKCDTEIRTKSSGETALELAERVQSHLEVRLTSAPKPGQWMHNAKKMPGEVIEVLDEGHRSLSMPISPKRRVDVDDHVTYLKLAYADGWIPLECVDNTWNLELLPETDWTEERPPPDSYFLYKVLVPVQLKSGPEGFAPNLLPVETKEPNDVVEVTRVVTFPQSKVSFVEVHPMGWLGVQLPSGRPLLERTSTFTSVSPSSPSATGGHTSCPSSTVAVIAGKSGVLERGHFFYCVKIAVGIREFPDIMSHRVGKGFHINTIVEGSQRFTPQGSPITYVKLLHERGWVFEGTMDGQVVLAPLHSQIQRDITRAFYRVLKSSIDVYSGPTFDSPVVAARKNIIECRERLQIEVPDGNLVFLKLRHAPGWVAETNRQGDKLVDAVEGGTSQSFKSHAESPKEAVTIEKPKFYRVKMSVPVRAAPDMDGPRLQGSFPKQVNSIVESSLRYIPPESNITYVKLAHEPGWLYESTLEGESVLETLTKEPEKQHGKFFYRARARVRVLVSPEPTSVVAKHIEENQVFCGALQFSLPDSDVVYAAVKEKGWVALDSPAASKCTVERISEAMYLLYVNPPSWVAVGFPNRTWFKVPEEGSPDVLAQETSLQNELSAAKQVLSSSSQGKDSVPLVRHGYLPTEPSPLPVLLEEIKHPANAILLTFPWKQMWWHVSFPEKTIVVELQHGLHGGFRAVYCNGDLMAQARLLWDSGDAYTFSFLNHSFEVKISLEGAFFSSNMQYYTYSLVVDGLPIRPGSVEDL
ncbi:unnamed protein product [Aphanomyces euteiches]